MGAVGTDRFLNNVVKRSYKDVIVNPLVLILIIPGCFGFPLYALWDLARTWHTSIFTFISPTIVYVAIGFTAILALGMAYILARSLNLHHSRDTDWMYALLGYAAYYGKDTSELEKMCDEMAGIVGRRYEYMTLAFFVLFTFFFSMQNFFFDLEIVQYPKDLTYALTIIIIVSVVIILATTLIHNLAVIYLMDNLQCRFTELFSELMSDDTEVVTMKSTIRMYEIRTHLILLICTLGVYSAVLCANFINTMNKHIRSQWDYEVRILNWMSAREGAEGIVRRKSATQRGGLYALLMRIP